QLYIRLPLPLAFLPAHQTLCPFPTRRSSDLPQHQAARAAGIQVSNRSPGATCVGSGRSRLITSCCAPPTSDKSNQMRSTRSSRRSEEHTSELQSRFDLVCRLLPEKKNKLKSQ